VIIGSGVLQVVAKAAHEAEADTADAHILSCFRAVGERVAGWIKGAAAVDEAKGDKLWLIIEGDGESVVFAAAAAMGDAVHHQFIDNDPEVISQPLLQSPFFGKLLDGGQ